MVTTMDCISPQAQQRVLPSLPLYQRCDVYALIAKFLEDEGADEVAAQVLIAAKALGVQPTNLTELVTQAQITAHMSHMLTQLLNQQMRDASLQMQPVRQRGDGMADLEMLALPSTTLPNHMQGGNSFPPAQEQPQGAGTYAHLPAGATPYQPMSPLPELPAPSPELGNHDASRMPELPPELPSETRAQQVLHPPQQNQQNQSPMQRTIEPPMPQQAGMQAQYLQLAHHAQHSSIGGAGNEAMQAQYTQIAQHTQHNSIGGVNNEHIQAQYSQISQHAQHNGIGGSGNEPLQAQYAQMAQHAQHSSIGGNGNEAQPAHSSAHRRRSSTFLMQQDYRVPDAPSVSSGGHAVPPRQGGIPITIAKSVHIVTHQMQTTAPTSSPNTSISFAMQGSLNMNRLPRQSDQMQPQLHADLNNHFNSMGGASRSISLHNNLQQHQHQLEQPQYQEAVTQRCDSHSRAPIQDLSTSHHTPMQHYNVMQPHHSEQQHSYPHVSPPIHQQPHEQHQSFQPMQYTQQSQQEQHQGGDSYHRVPSEHDMHMMQNVHHHQQQQHQHLQQLPQQHVHDYQPDGLSNYHNQHSHVMQHQQLPMQMDEAQEQALQQAQQDLNVPLLTDTPINMEPDDMPITQHRQPPPDETGTILDLIRGDEDDDECDIQDHLAAPIASAAVPMQNVGPAREEDQALHLKPLLTRHVIPSEEGELDPRLHQVTPGSPADLMAQGVLTPALDYSDSPLDEHVDDIGSGRGRSSWDAENGQHTQHDALDDPTEQLSTAQGDVSSAGHDRLQDNGTYPDAHSNDASPVAAPKQSKRAVVWPYHGDNRPVGSQKDGERTGQSGNPAKLASRAGGSKDLQEAREDGKSKTKRAGKDHESNQQTAQDRLSQPRTVLADGQLGMNDRVDRKTADPELRTKEPRSAKKEKRKRKHRDDSRHKHEHKHQRRSKGGNHIKDRSVSPQSPRSSDHSDVDDVRGLHQSAARAGMPEEGRRRRHKSDEPYSSGRKNKRNSRRLMSPSSPPHFPTHADDLAPANQQQHVLDYHSLSPPSRRRSPSPNYKHHRRQRDDSSRKAEKSSKDRDSPELHWQRSNLKHPEPSQRHERHSRSCSPDHNRRHSRSPPAQTDRRHAKSPSPIRKHQSLSHSSAPKPNANAPHQFDRRRYSPSRSPPNKYRSLSPSPVRSKRPQSPAQSQQQPTQRLQAGSRTAERQASIGIGRECQQPMNDTPMPQEPDARGRRQDQLQAGGHASLCDRMNDRNMAAGQQFKFVDRRNRQYRKQEDVDDTNSGSPYVDGASRFNKKAESMYNNKTHKGIATANKDQQGRNTPTDVGYRSHHGIDGKQQGTNNDQSDSPYPEPVSRHKDRDDVHNDKTRKPFSFVYKHQQAANKPRDINSRSDRHVDGVVQRKDSQSSGQIGYVNRKSSNPNSQTDNWTGKRDNSLAPKQLTNLANRVNHAKQTGKQQRQSYDDAYEDQPTQLQRHNSAYNQSGNKRSWQTSGRQNTETDGDDAAFRNGNSSKRSRI